MSSFQKAPLPLFIVSALVLLSSCGQPQDDAASDVARSPSVGHSDSADAQIADRPPPGSNEMLRARLSMAEGLEVIISDVVIPPNATVPRHYHPGEEFVYALEGSVVHVQEGQPDRIVEAGEAFVIPPEAVHAPRAGSEGGRAIVFRVHVEGHEERILVDE